MTHSCAYEGSVRHRRHAPAHELRMRLFMLYLDLDELPELFDGYRPLASARGRALVEFRRADHLGDPCVSLAAQVRSLVALRAGVTDVGPVRLLTTPRAFGHAFNPVSFYYCFEPAGERLAAIVAEVTNTPWGERHAYVLVPDGGWTPGAVMRGTFAKEFHVSPFMAMDHAYHWRLTAPGERLLVHIDSRRDGRSLFDATLSLRRLALTPTSVARLVARHPLQGAQTLARIYANGLSLWRKGAPYHRNPSGAPAFGRARTEHARASREDAGAGPHRTDAEGTVRAVPVAGEDRRPH